MLLFVDYTVLSRRAAQWNMQAAEITRKTAPLVKLLRAAHPATPIVLAEGTPDGDLWFEKSHSRQQANNAALKTEYLKLKAAGDSKLFYVESTPLYQRTNADFENPTVGGCVCPCPLDTAEPLFRTSPYLTHELLPFAIMTQLSPIRSWGARYRVILR